MEPTKTELQKLLTDATNRAVDAETRLAKLTRKHETQAQALREAESQVADLARTLDTTHEELRAANGSLKAYKGAATKARGEATILKRQVSPERRPIGALRAPRSDQEAADRADALAAAFAQDTTELVFSDGKREIRELAPLTITGDAWRETPSGRVLHYEPLLEPGDCNQEQLILRGCGLLNEAGEQVGYCAFNDAIAIGRNQRFQLPYNTIRF